MNIGTSASLSEHLTPFRSADRDFFWVGLFVILVVLEGTVGKWVSSALEYLPVVARDIIGILIIYRAWSSGRIRQHTHIFSLLLFWTMVVVIFTFLQLLVLGQNLIVMAIGLRFWVLYLWVTLAICCTISWTGYHRLCRLLVKLMWLMLPLLLVQNRSGADAWINKSSNDGGYIFTIADNVVRAAGTFSFTLGFTCFLALLTPLLLSPVPRVDIPRQQSDRASWFGMGMLVVAAVVSGSRGAMAISIFMGAMAVVASLVWGTKGAGVAMAGAAVVAILFWILPAVMPETLDAIETRVILADQSEDTLLRTWYTLVGSPEAWASMELIGEGLGLAANMSARIAGIENRGEFTLAEAEIDRVLLAGGVLGILWQGVKLAVISRGLWSGFRGTTQSKWTRPFLTWIAAGIALLTWPISGQLAAQALCALLLALAAMSVGLFDHTRP